MGLLIQKIESAQIKSAVPDLRPGTTVEVSVRVIEGDKERQQKFRGEVTNVRGAGMRKTFTVRKISEGIGVERTWPLHSPSIADIKVMGQKKVRRAKLFSLRKKKGKVEPASLFSATKRRQDYEGERPVLCSGNKQKTNAEPD